MKRTLLPLLIFCLVLLESCNKPVQVLLILGGHQFDTTEFFDVFEGMEQVEIDPVYYPRAMQMLQQTDAYDVLVFYDYMPILPLEDSIVFQDLTRHGKPILFLHHAICSFQQWDGYLEMLGGKYVMPGYETDSSLLSDYKHSIDMKVKVLDSGHPATLGMTDFTIHDEGYNNLTIKKDVTSLLMTNHPDSSPLVAWTHTHKNSDIVCLTLGHDKKAYENPAFLQFIEQTVHWLAENTWD